MQCSRESTYRRKAKNSDLRLHVRSWNQVSSTPIIIKSRTQTLQRSHSGHCPTGQSSMPRRDTLTPAFSTAFFTTMEVWEQPQGPLMDEQVKKRRPGHTAQCYLAFLGNWPSLMLMTWVKMEGMIMLSEMSQPQEKKRHDLTSIWILSKLNT